MHRVPSPEPVTQGRMHSKGLRRESLPGPRDPLAQGVRSGILNLALWGVWRRVPKGGSGRRSPALISAPCAHRRPLRPAAWARRARPGAQSGVPAAAGGERTGWAAPARRDGDSNGAAVGLRPSSPAPPRRPRPPQPRGLPGLVVPNLASSRSSPDILTLRTAWVEAGWRGNRERGEKWERRGPQSP